MPFRIVGELSPQGVKRFGRNHRVVVARREENLSAANRLRGVRKAHRTGVRQDVVHHRFVGFPMKHMQPFADKECRQILFRHPLSHVADVAWRDHGDAADTDIPRGGVYHAVAAHRMPDEVDGLRVDPVFRRRFPRHRPRRQVFGVADAARDGVFALAPPCATMVRDHHDDPRPAQVVRHVVPAREPRETVADDRARTRPFELRRRHKHLPVDRASVAV